MTDSAAPTRLYVGTYTSPQSHSPAPTGRGVHVLDFDAETGTLGSATLAAPLDNPSFLARGADGTVYAVLEEDEGRVVALRPSGDGRTLTSLGGRSTRGSAPAFVSVTPEGRLVLVATYGGGAVLAYPVREDGSLGETLMRDDHVGTGPNEERQDGPHAHSVRPAPHGRVALSADLGTDEITTYDLTREVPGRAATTRLPGGSGPRHVAFSPDSKLAVVTLELAGGLAVLRLDEGAPELVRVVPPAEEGDQPGEAAFSPDGRFVYVSVRGRDALDVYALAEGGELERVQGVPTGGHVPRHLVLTPDGRFVLVGNQEGGTVAVFPRDADSGRVGKARLFEAPTPAGLLLV